MLTAEQKLRRIENIVKKPKKNCKYAYSHHHRGTESFVVSILTLVYLFDVLWLGHRKFGSNHDLNSVAYFGPYKQRCI